MFVLRRVAARALASHSITSPIRVVPQYSRVYSIALSRCRQPSIASALQRGYASDSTPAETRAEPTAEGEIEHHEDSIGTKPERVNQIPTGKGEGEGVEASEVLSEGPDTVIEDTVGQSSGATITEAVKSAANRATDAASQTTSRVQDATGAVADKISDAAGAIAGEAKVAGTPSGRSQDTILFVGNLFYDVTGDMLKEAFSKFGNVKSAKIMYDNRGLSKGFGWIELDSQEAMESAIKEMHNTMFEGRMISVAQSVRKERQQRGRPTATELSDKPKNTPTRTLFIGNMSYEMTDSDLNALFRPIRNVIDVRVAIDRRTGQPRGFAHADFIDVESAKAAAEHLQQQEIYGRRLRVDYSSSYGPKPRS